MTEAVVQGVEKPANGLKGLAHLRHDILSGVVVSLVSLPLSSGIAIASGVPPIYGLMSAIIAGLLFPFIGGAYMTISGPAAGLAPALVAVMTSLGGAGDADATGPGYPWLLCVIFMVGCAQLLIALAGLARYAAAIPIAVVEGMLCSIGLMIIVKQFPSFFGFADRVTAKEFYQFVLSIPQFAQGLTFPVFLTSAVTLVALFVLGGLQKKVRLLQILPPQLLAVVLGTVLGLVLNLGSMNSGKFLISIPAGLSMHFSVPDFAGLLARRDLWYAVAMGVIMLTMIDGVESLATAMAIDRIDPYRRRSNPNRVLLAMAISNVASSLVGGLTIIPGGVKSKANIAAGGRTLWANFTNSICLIIYIAVGYQLINLIPRGVLASVLLYTGWKMCEPAVWRHVAHVGRDQLIVFTFTVLVTVAMDLLIGIIAGTILQFILSALACRAAARSCGRREVRLSELFSNPVVHKGWVGDEYYIYVDKPVMPTNQRLLQRELDGLPDDVRKVTVHLNSDPSGWEGVGGFLMNPVDAAEQAGDAWHIHLTRPLVCFSLMKLSDELDRVPASATEVVLHLDRGVLLIDHSACDQLNSFITELRASGRTVEIRGFDRLTPYSGHPSSGRIFRGSRGTIQSLPQPV
jgi:MFS superfamily sulfate permease-like transporter